VVSEAAVHVVEEVLGLDEEATVAGLEGAQQDGAGEAGLADAGGSDEDDVLGAAEKAELAELQEHGLADAGLAVPREGVEGPALGQTGASDAVLGEALLLVLVLLAQQAGEEVGVAGALGLGVGELSPEDRPQSREPQSEQELIEVVSRRRRRRRRCRSRRDRGR